jgi:hypothetical protein
MRINNECEERWQWRKRAFEAGCLEESGLGCFTLCELKMVSVMYGFCTCKSSQG